MNAEEAIEWLEECAKYFDKMQVSTEEDRGFWAYGKNAANARAIAKMMRKEMVEKMLKEEIVKRLKEGVYNLKFTKVDGTERKMTATLREDLLPLPELETKETRYKTPNPDVVPVWDLDKHGWRSFRVDSLISMEETL